MEPRGDAPVVAPANVSEGVMEGIMLDQDGRKVVQGTDGVLYVLASP